MNDHYRMEADSAEEKMAVFPNGRFVSIEKYGYRGKIYVVASFENVTPMVYDYDVEHWEVALAKFYQCVKIQGDMWRAMAKEKAVA